MPENIRVGVYDWEKFAVKGTFYPPDMPLEWRLAFFANEFETACLRLTDERLRQPIDFEWLQDLAEGFRLYFTMPTTDCGQSELLLQQEHFKSVICQAGIASDHQFIDATQCWTPQSPQTSACALLPGDATLADYRRWIDRWQEPLVTDQGQQPSLLWLQGETAYAGKLSEVRTLVELMGL